MPRYLYPQVNCSEKWAFERCLNTYFVCRFIHSQHYCVCLCPILTINKMNKNLFLLPVTALFVLMLSCTGNKENKAADGELPNWTLVWEEDFDGKTLDTGVWSKIQRDKKDNRKRYMTDNDGLFVFQDGNLVLRGLQNTFLPGDEAPFLTSGVSTQGKKTFGLGRIEIRVKLNPSAGTWPSVWMLPKEGDWPIGGEIDIMERYGLDEFVYQSIRTKYTHELGMADNPPSSVLVGVKPNNYHTYGVERYQDSLVFFVDDIRTKVYPRILTDMEEQFPFADQEFYLLLGMQFDSSASADSTMTPSEMFIDHVRFYEPK